MTHEEITEILKSHAEWLQNCEHGKHANLRGANLIGANLIGANLSNANLSGANLRGADLRGADLSDADLRGANLGGVNLSGSNLSDANLSYADLSDANLRYADLSNANLIGANLSSAKGVIVASCHWTYHGEQGRQVNAMLIDNTIMFFCGCFIGDELKLREYIENGDVKLQRSRLKALDFLLTCFEPTK